MPTKKYELFNRDTTSIIFGLQVNAIQRMLDFDRACGRDKPSVVAVINENKDGWHKVFWGEKEILIPMYRTTRKACELHPEADVLINFASFRSAYRSSMKAMEEKSIRTLVIIAEGIPERRARGIRKKALETGKTVIGPATVGGIVAGAFKIANTGGTLENILESKLHRQGHVGFVSKSGGMSNEAYNIIARNTDGLCEGIAIGGDSFPGSTLFEHIIRYEANPNIGMIVVLGELGGLEEYKIVDALKEGKITKPVVAWVTGTCAKILPASIQFGHAGAKADSADESADAKNKALRDAGARVPQSFDDFGLAVKKAYDELVESGKIKPVTEVAPPPVPSDFAAARSEGLVRRKTEVVTTIADDSGEELLYAGVPISRFIEGGGSIGGVIGLLWFKKKLPKFATDFIELVLILTADHGPAVSGAHNAIVTARAGRDLMSAVASGVLTIGPRFGGAVSGAAEMIKGAVDEGLSPADFVIKMKAKGTNIQGIGHRVKSLRNPDKRVELLKDYAKRKFKKTPYLDYVLQVEAITTKKKDTLILNVDGCIGILFLDLMTELGFAKEELEEIIANGGLNGLFVLGRTIGLIGHFMDQKRIKEGLYRQPWESILYSLPKESELETL
ncbi:MAG: ATP citrate synthase [Deltaproteobacteria bacterium]|nr:ATP citrate synthase [Deltaproteobacteria bacterium]